MRIIKPSHFLRMLYPSILWEMPKGKKKIYLTFDDGPHPTITPQVLELLKKFNAKATFFCIGENISAYLEIFEMIKKENHEVGNHTYNHLNGWMTKTDKYIESVEKTNDLIGTNIFRPPYGKIKHHQIKRLLYHYNIIAWSVIAYDWDSSLSSDDCYDNVIKNAEDGSIIVFHDNKKAAKNMLPAVEKVLEYYTGKGFTFNCL